MPHAAEIWIKGALCLFALVALLSRSRRASPVPAGRAGHLLAGAALAAVAAYYNFGLFHGAGYVHHWETFHYVLGSKYFPELGYDGLYLASARAEIEANGGLRFLPNVRDLSTNEVVPTASLEAKMEGVKGRFTGERWRSFVADNQHFVESNDPAYLAKVRTDHGYNPTPAWTFVARLLDGWLPVTPATLALWASVDPLLLAGAFVLVFLTFGPLVGTLCLVVFGLGYPWRFDWVGGAFLRQDWLAAFLAAVCMVKRERYAAAGAFLGYAISVRLFPAAFLFGPAVLALRALVKKEETAWLRRLALGVVLSTALCVLAGSLAGRGASGWVEFGKNFQKHRATWLTNNVGIKNTLLYGPETWSRRLVDFSQPEPWARWQLKMDRMEAERRPLLALASLAFLAAVAAAVWRADRTEALLLGVPAVFAAGVLTCYYWVMLSALPMARRAWLVAATLSLSLALFALDLVTPSFELIYGVMSWLLLALFGTWVGRVALGLADEPPPAPPVPAESRRERRKKRGR